VLHYDLPWNPNRIEQREGRIDRYGQTAKVVKTLLLVGRENPIDGVVLRVLLRKAREIRRTTGIAVAFPDDSKSILDAVLSAVLFEQPRGEQLTLGLDIVGRKESEVAEAMNRALQREKESQSVYAQHAIDPREIEEDLKETDVALGDPAVVESFVVRAAQALNAQCEKRKAAGCYTLLPAGLPLTLRMHLAQGSRVPITFISPVPEGYHYLGRNHPFVEALCQYLMRLAFDRDERFRPARAAVIRTDAVDTRTTILLFRIRSVIRERGARTRDVIAEELMAWGFSGDPSDSRWLEPDAARELLAKATPAANMSTPERSEFLGHSLDDLDALKSQFAELTRERTKALVASHARYRAAIGGAPCEGVEPVLPPDVLGTYVLLPVAKRQR